MRSRPAIRACLEFVPQGSAGSRHRAASGGHRGNVALPRLAGTTSLVSHETALAGAGASAARFDHAFRAHIARIAQGAAWTPRQLDRRMRSLATLALTAALGHQEALKPRDRASRNADASPADSAEVLIRVDAYAGIPAANAPVRVARETPREMEQ
jgi:alkylhydroperoxidase/carboxymuconolactone decarboxylase family protein YurZ